MLASSFFEFVIVNCIFHVLPEKETPGADKSRNVLATRHHPEEMFLFGKCCFERFMNLGLDAVWFVAPSYRNYVLFKST
jgi:hypothetical protein